MKKLAMLSVLLVASACVAGTATLSLEVDSVAKTYSIYADLDGAGVCGLDTFNFDVIFGGGLAPATGSLKVVGWNSKYLGFCTSKSNGVLTAPGVVNYAASQDSAYGNVYDELEDSDIVLGVALNKTLLASGTFTGDNGTMSLFVPAASSGLPQIVFLAETSSGSGTWKGPGSLAGVSSVTKMGVLDGEATTLPITIPEPTTIGLLCMGLLGLIRRK